jgi:hypothetical protein
MGVRVRASSLVHRAHVGQLLFLGGVHVQVGVQVVLAYDHALVYLFARRYEEPAPGLQVVQAVGDAHARAVRYEEAGEAVGKSPRYSS